MSFVCKGVASVFWDCEGVQKVRTIYGEHYASNLRQLKEAIKSKRQGNLRPNVLLAHDNVAVRTAQVTVAEAERCGFELLSYPPYSPVLAPSDFYLIPKMKYHLRVAV